MAKKNLTQEQKISRFKRKRRLGIALGIMATLLAVALMIPATYYGYYGIVFGAMAGGEEGHKSTGKGFSRPLNAISDDEANGSFIFAYYHNGGWVVIDDTEKIISNRDNFIIYKADDNWHAGTYLQYYIIMNNEVKVHLPLSTFTLIDDRCFSDCKKIMTTEEFNAYRGERHIRSFAFY